MASITLTDAQVAALAPLFAAVGIVVDGTAPADQAPAPSEFVAWLRETAPARKARKASNREMADWLRSKNLPANGPVWDAAKAGERSVRALRKLA